MRDPLVTSHMPQAPAPERITETAQATGPVPPKRQAKGKYTRGATNQAEEARRKEWGKKWGNVGREWKQQHNPRGT